MQSPLTEAATDLAPVVRFTVRPTDDIDGDLAFNRRVAAMLDTWPGKNKVLMRIMGRDGGSTTVRWEAYADRDLRIALGRMLAERGVELVGSRDA